MGFGPRLGSSKTFNSAKLRYKKIRYRTPDDLRKNSELRHLVSHLIIMAVYGHPRGKVSRKSNKMFDVLYTNQIDIF